MDHKFWSVINIILFNEVDKSFELNSCQSSSVATASTEADDQSNNRNTYDPSHQLQANEALIVRKVDHEVWSIECTIEELVLDLSKVVENITCLEDNNSQAMKTQTVKKYYRQAKVLAKWIPIAKPVPEFVINVKDLSPKVIEELEARIDDDLSTFTYILKQAVGRIFENLDHAYYHLSIARNLRVRMEP
jgi:hypothetical protein